MRLILSLFFVLFVVQSTYTQDLDGKLYLNSIVHSNPKIDFESELISLSTLFENNESRTFFNANSIFKCDAKELNTRFFSNIRLVESKYYEPSLYLLSCGPLEHGISNSIDGGDLMLSMVIDNFVNHILFPEGVFFRNK